MTTGTEVTRLKTEKNLILNQDSNPGPIAHKPPTLSTRLPVPAKSPKTTHLQSGG